MTDKKTSQEPDAGALDGTELVRIVKGGANARTTLGQIAALAASAPAPAPAPAPGGAALPAVNSQTGTSYPLALTDAPAASAGRGIVRMTCPDPNVVHVPAYASVPFEPGTTIQVIQGGNGSTSIAPDAGVSIVAPLSRQARARYSSLFLSCMAHDDWVLSGDAFIPTDGDPLWSKVAFLLNFDPIAGAPLTGVTAIQDLGPQALTVYSPGVPRITDTFSKWGGGSLVASTDGDGHYGASVRMASDTVRIGTRDFTLEGWVYQKDLPTLAGFFGQEQADGTADRFFIGSLQTDGSAVTLWRNGNNYINSATGVLKTNVWQFIQYTRSAGVSTCYVDGVAAFTFADDFNYDSAAPWAVGLVGSGVNGQTGYIDDVRLTIGATRTSDVPTEAFKTHG